MAHGGSSNSEWEIVLNDEIYTGRTTISSISSPNEKRSGQPERLDNSADSEHCDRSDNSDHSEIAKMLEHSILSKNNLRRASVSSLEVRESQPWQPSKIKIETNLFKHNEASSSSSSTPLSLPPAECRTYTHSKATSNSLYSYSEMYGSLNRMDDQGHCVPSLTLTSRGSAFDYMRKVHRLKLDRQPQVAYEEWYATKERLRQQELQRQKMERENEMMEDELRKNLSKQCYSQWLRSKAQQAAERRMQEHLERAAIKAAGSVAAGNKARRNASQAEVRKVVESWWHKKQEQQKRQRLQQQHNLLQKEREEQLRKQQAELAWQAWISNVYAKPKPVPLNQGMDSLRGSVSAMYINPVPWQHVKKE